MEEGWRVAISQRAAAINDRLQRPTPRPCTDGFKNSRPRPRRHCLADKLIGSPCISRQSATPLFFPASLSAVLLSFLLTLLLYFFSN